MKSKPEPAGPDPYKQAQDINQANTAFNPQAAQSQYNILSNPSYGAGPTTQLYENIRQQVFPQESQVRNQLTQNILQSLISPNGASPDQQRSVDDIRAKSQNELVRSIRDRANLGGNLYGGRDQQFEAEQVGGLQNQFAQEDINRDMMNRQNSIQSALPILQLLFNQQIQSPQYQSPVQSPDTYASSMNSYNNNLAQQQASQSQLYSALFGALGTGVGAAVGGPPGAAVGSQLKYAGPGAFSQTPYR